MVQQPDRGDQPLRISRYKGYIFPDMYLPEAAEAMYQAIDAGYVGRLLLLELINRKIRQHLTEEVDLQIFDTFHTALTAVLEGKAEADKVSELQRELRIRLASLLRVNSVTPPWLFIITAFSDFTNIVRRVRPDLSSDLVLLTQELLEAYESLSSARVLDIIAIVLIDRLDTYPEAAAFLERMGITRS